MRPSEYECHRPASGSRPVGRIGKSRKRWEKIVHDRFLQGHHARHLQGPAIDDPLAYRHYNKDEIVLGKRMEDHIRPAVAYWHTFAWEGGDPFGGRTFDRPWYDKGMDGAKLKADVAFEFFDLLDIPFFCFHDADVAPEGATPRREQQEPPHHHRHLRQEDAEDRAPGCSGAPPTSSPTAATWRAPRPIPIRTCSPTPPAQVKNVLEHHPRAGRRELRSMGRPRRLRDAAQHRHQAGAGPGRRASSRWSSSTPRRSASRAPS